MPKSSASKTAEQLREEKLAQRRARRAARKAGVTKNADTPQAKAAQTKRLAKGSGGAAKIPRSRAGRPNRLGATAKQLLEEGFEILGGIDGLVRWGAQNPTEFYRIWARLIPRDTVVNPGEGLEAMLARLEQQRSGHSPVVEGQFAEVAATDQSMIGTSYKVNGRAGVAELIAHGGAPGPEVSDERR